MGFKGMTFPPAPNAGGFDLGRAGALRSGPPSTRRLIMVKGYQHWVGRALVALRALEACADALRGFSICVYSATRDVVAEAHALARRTGLGVEVLPLGVEVPHDELLRRHGRARFSLGLSTSDGISTSFLEALIMGSFPIQSWTSCANEWIADGETGILVPPEDPGAVSDAIRRALADDRLVDEAAERNWRTALERLDAGQLALRAAEMYEQVVRLSRPAPGLRPPDGGATPEGAT
jgi:glycosyltransferase involved in cell wall biosynthesis